MVGLGEGARYLVEYPYGCAEQRGSRTLALVLAADLGDAFSLPGMDTEKMRPSAQQNLKELEKFQCCERRLRVLARRLPRHVAVPHGVPAARLQDRRRPEVPGRRRHARARLRLSRAGAVGRSRRRNEGWWPSYTAWQAFAVKVLVEGGRNQDSNLTRLYGYRDRMPVFALAYLHDALVARGGASADSAGTHRRPAPPHGERDPARGGQRARRGAERSVPALVLELQRAHDGDRAQLARQGRRRPTRRCGRWCAG